MFFPKLSLMDLQCLIDCRGMSHNTTSDQGPANGCTTMGLCSWDTLFLPCTQPSWNIWNFVEWWNNLWRLLQRQVGNDTLQCCTQVLWSLPINFESVPKGGHPSAIAWVYMFKNQGVNIEVTPLMSLMTHSQNIYLLSPKNVWFANLEVLGPKGEMLLLGNTAMVATQVHSSANLGSWHPSQPSETAICSLQGWPWLSERLLPGHTVELCQRCIVLYGTLLTAVKEKLDSQLTQES